LPAILSPARCRLVTPIDRVRLCELDREWDIERVLETNAPSREIEIERVALKILRGDFAEATRRANGRALEPDRALRVAKA
jgi:hypothetical protein